ncbi:MAG: hypothetical protein Q4C91_22660 [Eubacteriales bacterium]|nr:hypothetical protein [Eubacteriales bacterium]
MNGEQAYAFCSDDKAARNGAISFENVRCISTVSSFLRLKKELLWLWDEAQPYIDSFVDFCEEHKQQTFKVIEVSDKTAFPFSRQAELSVPWISP